MNLPSNCIWVSSPGMWWVGHCEPVLYVILPAGAIKRMATPPCGGVIPIFRQVSKLVSVISQDSVNLVGYRLDMCVQESSRGDPICFLLQLDESKFQCAVYGDEHVKFALLGNPSLRSRTVRQRSDNEHDTLCRQS